MSYGTPDWEAWVLPEEEGIKQIKAAYDLGINTFDTANVYSNGLSEVILGKAIKEHKLPRDEIVVMTKVFFTVGKKYSTPSMEKTEANGYVNQKGLSRKHIFESVKHSLDRLQLDYVDVLQCHRFDENTPIEETMHALHDVVQAGYARYIGMSSCWAWQFHAMQNYAINNHLTPFISMQNHYSLIYREEEREMMPTLKHFGVGSIPWSPLARGLLTRPLDATKATKRGESDQWVNSYLKFEKDKDLVKRLEEISKAKNASMAQIALAWVMQKDAVSAPIVGTTSLDNLKDLIGAVQITLTEEEVNSLDDLYQARPVFGHS